MAAKISTGLRNYLMATDSLHAALSTLVMKIYDGTVPATADAALSGNTLLCLITVGGDGTTPLTWDNTPVSGVLVKESSDTWEGTNADAGTATFFRLCTLADAGTGSTSALRVQGACALVGAELNLSSTTLVAAAPQVIDNFSITLPAE